MMKRPFFMTNKEWYYYDEKKKKHVLTDKAPPEAVKSYEEYYATLEEARKQGIWI